MRGVAHFVHGLVQSLDDRRHQGSRHIADAQADDPAVRVGILEIRDLARDVGKKIIALELEKIRIDRNHAVLGIVR